MAMTAAQWAQLQVMLPQEDRMSYEQYLATIGQTPSPQASTTTAQAATNLRDVGFEQAAAAAGQPFVQPSPTPEYSTAQRVDRYGRTVQVYSSGPQAGTIVGSGGVLYEPPQEIVEPPTDTTPKSPAGIAGGAKPPSSKTPVQPGGITQAQLDAALAAQAATFAAQQKEAAARASAEREAEKRATKQKASDKLVALFESYNLGGLAKFIDKRIMEDVSEDMLMLEIYERPEYQTRFPGMAALRKQGKAISESEYMRIENAMQQTARFFDLPQGFYDGPEDFGNLIGKGVSAKEYQDRLQVGQDLSRTLNPQIKTALVDFFGIGEGALTAYVLDPDKALGLIQKQARAAQFVGFAREAGFGLSDITAESATNIAGTAPYASLSEQQLQRSLQQAGQLRKEQSRLAGIEGEVYNEQEALDAVIAGSSEALLASQRRAEREVSRFRGTSGLTGSSLRSSSLI